jgi:hypothetical protein
VRGLIGETWRLLRSRLGALLAVALVLLVPAELAFAYAREDSESAGIVALVLLYLVGYTWVSAALYATLDRRATGAVRPYGAIVDRLPALIVLNVIITIPILVGLLLLVVPGLLLAARWSASGALVTLERDGPIRALELSNELVRGRTWSVVGAGVLIALAAITVAVPGLVVTEVAEATWAKAVGEVLIDVALFLPLTVFSYAVFRQGRAV